MRFGNIDMVLAFVLTLTLIVSETQRNVAHSYLGTFLERGATLPGIGFGNTDSNDTVYVVNESCVAADCSHNRHQDLVRADEASQGAADHLQLAAPLRPSGKWKLRLVMGLRIVR